jgi:hypothetical protein
MADRTRANLPGSMHSIRVWSILGAALAEATQANGRHTPQAKRLIFIRSGLGWDYRISLPNAS